MISWCWLIPTALLSATIGALAVAWCVDSARRREAAEYDLILRNIAKARRAESPHGYCQTREHADRARRRGG